MLSGVSINCLTFLALESWLGNRDTLGRRSVLPRPKMVTQDETTGQYEDICLLYELCSRSILSSANRALQFDLLDKDEIKVISSHDLKH